MGNGEWGNWHLSWRWTAGLGWWPAILEADRKRIKRNFVYKINFWKGKRIRFL